MDIILYPLVKHVKSYIRDDQDFLKYLPEDIKESEIMACFDVVGLYRHLNPKSCLDNYREWSRRRLEGNFILESCKLILESNSFEFNDNNYIQIMGTAMGTKFVTSYATLVIGYLEIKLYQLVDRTFNSDIKVKVEQRFKQYLDDCFIIWDKQDGDINPK